MSVQTTAEDDPILSCNQVAELLDKTWLTLHRWRKSGTGPNWSRIGERTIYYKMSDIIAWKEEMSGPSS